MAVLPKRGLISPNGVLIFSGNIPNPLAIIPERLLYLIFCCAFSIATSFLIAISSLGVAPKVLALMLDRLISDSLGEIPLTPLSSPESLPDKLDLDNSLS